MAYSIGQDWIEATRRNLQGQFVEQRNTLGANYVAGSGTLTFTTQNPVITAGAILSIGLNTLYVTSSNQATLTATVIGGQNGSVDANATAGALIRINPNFTDSEIWMALQSDLNDLSSPLNGLYGMAYTDLTFLSNVFGYDLGTTAASNLISAYEIRYLTPGNYKDSPRLKQFSWKENRLAVASNIASGMGVEIVDSEGMTPGLNMRVFWKSVFTMPTDPTQNLSTSLVPTSAYDLPPLGASITIMAGREIMRNSPQQQDYRRATEVPAGAVAASANGLKQLRQLRIDAEAARLLANYPIYQD